MVSKIPLLDETEISGKAGSVLSNNRKFDLVLISVSLTNFSHLERSKLYEIYRSYHGRVSMVEQNKYNQF